MKNKLNFSYFTGNSLFAFVRALLKIIDSSKFPDGLLKALLVKVESIYAYFSKGVEYDSKDPLTISAIEKDTLRDKYYNGMKNFIKSFLNSPDQQKALAAEKLVAVIKKYGWDAARYSFDKETTAITKCIEDMITNHPREVTALALMESWITPLTEAQEAFEMVQLQRVENGATDVPTVSQYRTPLRKAVRILIETLDTTASNSNDETIKGYAEQVDELIGRTMATLKSSASRSDNDDTDNSSGGETNPDAAK
jgi:hypothetical protein